MDGFLDNAPAQSVRDRLGNFEVETFFLGTMMFYPTMYDRVGWLSEEDFSNQLTGDIWSVMRALRREHSGAKFDPEIVVPRLAARGYPLEDARKFVATCAASGSAATQAVVYASTIRDLAQRRRFLDLVNEATVGVEDLDTPSSEMFARLSGDIQRLAAGDGRKVRTKRQVSEEIATGLDEKAEAYWTDLRALDEAMGGGMYAGRMYGFAARKKVGKTVLLGTISDNLSAAKVPHLFVAMETPAVEIEQRNMAKAGGFNSIHFLRRENETLDARVRELAASSNDYARYLDAPGATFDEIKSEIMREIVAHGIKGVIIDYWQLVQGRNARDNEELHLRNVAQGFADICRKEKIFMAVAAQVNQEGNTRGGEGLKLACDQYYTLHREKDDANAWMEMEESRYTIYQNVGTEDLPGLILSKHGPAFVDAGYRGSK